MPCAHLQTSLSEVDGFSDGDLQVLGEQTLIFLAGNHLSTCIPALVRFFWDCKYSKTREASYVWYL